MSVLWRFRMSTHTVTPLMYRTHIWAVCVIGIRCHSFQHLRNSIPRCSFLSILFWQEWQRRRLWGPFALSHHQSYGSLCLSAALSNTSCQSVAKAHWISVSTSQQRDLYVFFIHWYSNHPASSSPYLSLSLYLPPPQKNPYIPHLQINTVVLLKLYISCSH